MAKTAPKIDDTEVHALMQAAQRDELSHLNERQIALIDAYTDEDSKTRFNKKQSLISAGYASSTQWKDVFPAVREAMLDRTKDILAEAGPSAAQQLIDYIMDPDATGGRDKLHAIQMLFDRIGVIKEERVEVEVTQNHVFVLPPKKPQEFVEGEYDVINEED